MSESTYINGIKMNYTKGAWVAEDTKIGEDVIIMPGAVIGRPPVSTKGLARKSSLDLVPVEIGNGSVIGSNVVLYRGLRIGRETLIGDTACIREGVIVGDECIIAMGVTINYDTSIGSRTKIMDNSHITGNMIIEEDVFISVLVTSANDNSMGRKRALDGPGEIQKLVGPRIGRYATIGQGACLLPGIKIGENSIVGANAVVTKDLPPRVLALGVPARIIRELNSSEIR